MVELYQKLAALFLYQQVRPCALASLKERRSKGLAPTPLQIDFAVAGILNWPRMLSQIQDHGGGNLDPGDYQEILEGEARKYHLNSTRLLGQCISIIDNNLKG